MPTYQYACTVCDHRFEQVQAFTDPSLTVCPECSGKLRKLYSSVGVVFKGSGFYRTDSRSGGAGSGKETGKADSSTSDSSSDAKSASTTDSSSSTTPKSDPKPASTSSTSSSPAATPA